MSYSICFKCKKMVSQWEKYCQMCETKYRQDETFWKDEPDAYELFNNPDLQKRELTQDEKK